MKRIERSWMYERVDVNKKLNPVFGKGVNEFIKHAKQLDLFRTNSGRIRCPCMKCNNAKFLIEHDVRSHLCKFGFRANYYDWVFHGEEFPIPINVQQERDVNPYEDMVNDALRDRIDHVREEMLNQEENNETPNPEVASFFEMLKNAKKPVCDGSSVSVLQSASRLLTLKCDHNLSHKCVDGIISLIKDILPKDNLMTSNFYETKKIRDVFMSKKTKMPETQPDSPVDESRLYYEAAGGYDKEGRVYGMGSGASIYYERPAAPRHSSAETYSPGIVTRLTQQMARDNEAQEKLRQEFEEYKKSQDEKTAWMEKILKEKFGSIPPGSCNPGSSQHRDDRSDHGPGGSDMGLGIVVKTEPGTEPDEGPVQ